MNNFSKTLIVTVVILSGLFLIHQSINVTNAAGIVPCGQLQDDLSTTDIKENKKCETCDILVLASRIINYMLFTFVPIVAALFYLVAGFLILMGGVNQGWIASGKNIFKTTTYSLFVIFGAWMITNSVLKSIAGDSLFTADWNKVVCQEVPHGQPLPTVSGGGTVPTPSVNPTITPTPSTGSGPSITPTPTPGGSVLACTFNGVNYASYSLCGGQARPGGCGTSTCSQYLPSINRHASGAATVDVLKTFMVIESDCNIRAGTSSSYGLMQIQPATANQFKNRCGITDNITSDWLTNPVNADKSICIGAAFINSIAAGTCGSEPRNLYAGYNAGPGNCAPSVDCTSNQSCGGGAMKKWECPYDNPAHSICNTGMYETKQGATYVNYCLNNLRF